MTLADVCGSIVSGVWDVDPSWEVSFTRTATRLSVTARNGRWTFRQEYDVVAILDSWGPPDFAEQLREELAR